MALPTVNFSLSKGSFSEDQVNQMINIYSSEAMMKYVYGETSSSMQFITVFTIDFCHNEYLFRHQRLC